MGRGLTPQGLQAERRQARECFALQRAEGGRVTLYRQAGRLLGVTNLRATHMTIAAKTNAMAKVEELVPSRTAMDVASAVTNALCALGMPAVYSTMHSLQQDGSRARWSQLTRGQKHASRQARCMHRCKPYGIHVPTQAIPYTPQLKANQSKAQHSTAPVQVQEELPGRACMSCCHSPPEPISRSQRHSRVSNHVSSPLATCATRKQSNAHSRGLRTQPLRSIAQTCRAPRADQHMCTCLHGARTHDVFPSLA